jgi:hypothetical protein
MANLEKIMTKIKLMPPDLKRYRTLSQYYFKHFDAFFYGIVLVPGSYEHQELNAICWKPSGTPFQHMLIDGKQDYKQSNEGNTTHKRWN